jgi:hypothetical protein
LPAAFPCLSPSAATYSRWRQHQLASLDNQLTSPLDTANHVIGLPPSCRTRRAASERCPTTLGGCCPPKHRDTQQGHRHPLLQHKRHAQLRRTSRGDIRGVHHPVRIFQILFGAGLGHFFWSGNLRHNIGGTHSGGLILRSNLGDLTALSSLPASRHASASSHTIPPIDKANYVIFQV